MLLKRDDLAEIRNQQLVTGLDSSFEKLVAPMAIKLLSNSQRTHIVEIGCGTGNFTKQLASLYRNVIAIDPSEISISFAKKNCSEFENITFFNSTFTKSVKNPHFLTDLIPTAVSVMSLMSILELEIFASELRKKLITNAVFVAVFTNPRTWPTYWGYEKENWFNSKTEVIIEAPFKTTSLKTNIITTHIHRPISMYLAIFANHGFRKQRIVEFGATKDDPLPRFLGIEWKVTQL